MNTVSESLPFLEPVKVIFLCWISIGKQFSAGLKLAEVAIGLHRVQSSGLEIFQLFRPNLVKHGYLGQVRINSLKDPFSPFLQLRT
jgi:hypothetical protein